MRPNLTNNNINNGNILNTSKPSSVNGLSGKHEGLLLNSTATLCDMILISNDKIIQQERS